MPGAPDGRTARCTGRAAARRRGRPPSAAWEYSRDGIWINAVCPGPVAAPMSRLPGESDAAVLWLASPESSFVIGHDLVVDGGATA